jgi:hypothetical protein
MEMPPRGRYLAVAEAGKVEESMHNADHAGEHGRRAVFDATEYST